MVGDQDRSRAAQARHWAGNRRLVAWLTGVWLLLTFVPPYFAHLLPIDVMGGPLPVWLLAQGAPITYVLIVWFYERRMDRLDRALRNADGD
jgi:putative solute:sodium symporter small subunit